MSLSVFIKNSQLFSVRPNAKLPAVFIPYQANAITVLKIFAWPKHFISLKPHTSGLWLLCLALLVVRISDAHWHLCHDGSEAPRALHIGDVALDDTNEPGHTDTDLKLVDSGLFKHLDYSGDLPLLFAAIAALCIFRIPARNLPLPAYRLLFPSSAYRHLPPSRGPPQ